MAARPLVHFHSDHSWFGGCETMLVNLLTRPEVRSRFAVSFSYRDSPRYAAELRQRMAIDFPVYPLRFSEPSYALPQVAQWRRPFDRIGRFLSRQLATIPLLLLEVMLLRRLFLRVRPDILHINNGGYPAALSARAAAIAGRLAGVPHVLMVVNNLAMGYSSPWSRIQYPLDRLVVRSVSCFLSGSAAAAARIRAVLALPAGQALSITQGADLRTPTETPEETRRRIGLANTTAVVFGIVALMEARKGHRILLEALGQGVRSGNAFPDFRLVLLGDGPLRPELERLATELGIRDRCFFVGKEENPMNVISSLDVLVLASIAYEDFPNVVLEAMGAGKAVIASRMAGTPEQVIEGETGLLVPPGDVGALSAAIARLGRDELLRHRMAEAGLARFNERFTAAASARRYADYYASLLRGDRQE